MKNTTDTIVFRKLASSDLEKLMEWRMSPEVTRFLLTDPKLTLEGQHAWFDAITRNRTALYWIVNFNGVDMGFCNLSYIDWANHHADPGMYICLPEFRGKGLGKHIMGNLISHAFGPCGLNKLHGPIIASNAAAISSYLKSGFKIEGYLRQHCLKDGEYHDLVLVGLVKSDWSEANIIKAEIDG